jgi:hypothetical protein
LIDCCRQVRTNPSIYGLFDELFDEMRRIQVLCVALKRGALLQLFLRLENSAFYSELRFVTVLRMARPRKSSMPPKNVESYQHPDSDLAARPEIGAQAHFKNVGMHKQIALKVIDPRGNELLVVKKMEETK